MIGFPTKEEKQLVLFISLFVADGGKCHFFSEQAEKRRDVLLRGGERQASAGRSEALTFWPVRSVR